MDVLEVAGHQLSPGETLVGATALWSFLILFAWWVLPGALRLKCADLLPSTLHGITASAMGLLAYFSGPAECVTTDATPQWLRLALFSTTGWLIVDCFSMFVLDVVLRWRPPSALVFFHHGVCIYGLQYAALTGIGVWFQVSLLFAELAVVPLNIVRIMKVLDLQGVLYSSLKPLVVVLWLISRVIFMPLLTWDFRSHGYCLEALGTFKSAAATFIFLSLWVMNCYWLAKLCLAAMKDTKTANHED